VEKKATLERVSAHETVNLMHEVLKKDEVSNVADRFEAQGNRCSFCEMGLSCQLCSNGPCRISKRAERGVCGIDANGMVMRNLLHKNIMGISAYTYHAREAAETLKATALGDTPFSIKDEEKLRSLANSLSIKGANAGETASKVADRIMWSINQPSNEESMMVEVFAPSTRKEIWRTLDIYPGGPAHEIVDATARSMTNIDGDYVSLAKTALRLGIASCYGALIPLEISQDIIFGTPFIHESNVDLGIIDPDYINIVPNGHEPFIGAALIEAARREEVQKRARETGAKGLRIVGSIETGQELMQRFADDDVFVGITGNWLNQEFAIATGGIDLFVMDMNCSVPSLKQIADKYNTKLVAVSKLVGVVGVDDHIDYQPELAGRQAKELINLAINNFMKRKNNKAIRDLKKTKIVTGFSTEALLRLLGGSIEPLLDIIKNGTLKGIVALVSCTSLKNGGQDLITTTVAKELIARDILVLSAGCGNAATQVAGLNSLSAQELAGPGLKAICGKLNIPPVLSFGTCTDVGRLVLLVTAVADALGIDPSQLPVAVTAPEYMEQKATIDAFGAVAFGLYTHVSPLPPVIGAPDVVKLLTHDVESLVGGKLAVEEDPIQAVDGIEKHINAKRQNLGI